MITVTAQEFQQRRAGLYVVHTTTLEGCPAGTDSWAFVAAAVEAGKLPRNPDKIDHDASFVHCHYYKDLQRKSPTRLVPSALRLSAYEFQQLQKKWPQGTLATIGGRDYIKTSSGGFPMYVELATGDASSISQLTYRNKPIAYAVTRLGRAV